MSDILDQARKEFDDELRRERVNQEKEKLRKKRRSRGFRGFLRSLKTKKLTIRLEERK